MSFMRAYLDMLDMLDTPVAPVRENFLRSLLAEDEILVEKTTPAEAAAILTQHGASPEVLASPAKLKSFRSRFMMANHPDKGGDLAAVQAVNDAYDIIGKTGYDGGSSRPSAADYYGDWSKPKPKNNGDTTWSHAGWSGGPPNSTSGSNNPKDINYWKKKLWELSGKSTEEWTIMNFDGHFFRGMIPTYGNIGIFHEMAKAMIAWDTHYEKRAIFVKKKNEKAMKLIWLDGKNINPSIPFFKGKSGARLEWDANQPYNDQQFMRRLPDILDDISAGRNKEDWQW